MLPRIASMGLVTLLLVSPVAQAYRPFDTTLPEVADPGQFDIEFGPVSLLREGDARTWIAPQARFNYGIADGWEAVVEGQREHEEGGRSTVTDTAFNLKHVVREGTLQGKEGWSVATEFGALLPGYHADHGMGASLTGIVGTTGQWGSVAMSLELERTRDHRNAQLAGFIVQGGAAVGGVRPVAELTYGHEQGEHDVRSALVGLIWDYHEGLALDIGIKRSFSGDLHTTELRLGVTVEF